ncbi:MAG: hypothetical protein ACI4OJ_12840 [Lachnospiraceae bacterium]
MFSASLTVEAAIVLPLFLFFCTNVLWLFEMVRFQSSMLLALHDAGQETAAYAFLAEAAKDLSVGEENLSFPVGAAGGALFSEGFVRNEVAPKLQAAHTVAGGVGGISYLQSEYDLVQGTVLLAADYQFRPFVPLIAPPGIPAQTVAYCHLWTGYEKTPEGIGDADTAVVYVTPTGEVYHRDRNCTYLAPSVQEISASHLGDARNSGGGRYYACEVCHPARSGILFITRSGNRYHCRMDCPSLKRTANAVTLGWALEHGYRACSKCGG